ncbi:hypothetical protein [Streptomyces cellulosae]|uniref:Uncharacterized protein n=1 Tax=Streptomyces cellulosae TaxID=1968 RepID=A0ABW7Y211_STRCE
MPKAISIQGPGPVAAGSVTFNVLTTVFASESAKMLPKKTVHLPEGSVIPEGAAKLRDGNFQLPHHEGPCYPRTRRRCAARR